MKGFFKKGLEDEDDSSEIHELRQSVLDKKMPEPVEKTVLKEIDRLFKIHPSSAEYTIGINYIDYLTTLPWNQYTEDNLDINHAESILDRAHYGLDEIKERILEHLAVRIMKLSAKKTILVVDDEKMTRMNLSHVLGKDGYEVEIAESGTKALEKMEETTFDLVITDLKMDKVDGLMLLDSIKKNSPGTEVIIITGYATVLTAVDAIKRGSFHFIAKPLKLDEVRTTVKSALSKKTGVMNTRSPVICFTGPPGTGKTSLGQSIATSLERKFVRISLAGIKDEADIRGHRRSYVGAMSGRIIQELRRAESNNPVFMLDEIDKIGQDFKGDPASALLEVLDPQQNSQFIDHYMDVPFDLSKVMFIATANTIGRIPAPLLDRFEVISLSGYTVEEKINIALRHLIPKAVEDAGLGRNPLVFSEAALKKIIREHTREAGLRELERKISSICRKITRKLVKQTMDPTDLEITEKRVDDLLGPSQYHFEIAGAKDRIGCATGLAWTETGGEIIFVEATKMMGSQQLILTGSLGDVMKESAQAALSYIRSNTQIFGLAPDFFHGHDIHIHVPAGAIPKDGPSAGLTLAMALLSLLKGKPCRRDTAMTGELTLSGRILPVSGIREKLLAAKIAGIKTVIIPLKNQAELPTLSETLIKGIRIVTAGELIEIMDIVLKDS
ncbi:MAG: endopeptidase La [Desulfobacula sp.]|jgi:ATP-dependent Lon protease|uniref:endopeptidase La n=2 Tax=Desulfobacula sp. TaxID=2593537 RepID=UPI001DCF7AE6|nr:endopeptidase La [Desulfobacula sp.]MBT3486023.1 endopeptidase La [Desulfobacula sp.]MBT3804960.1 endopeptidase La [Desulfobacula sp.]MBT4025448.1 endopeptidase La [Desulfobacula sp.]MBT4198718.1 endopeptidase La [Desulfobacula sp.]